VSGPSRGWSTMSSPKPAGVPASCPPPRWSLPSGSAGDNSAGCARSPFVA